MIFRSGPLRVRVELPQLSTADQHELICAFEFSARVGERPSDQQLFTEAFGGDSLAISRVDVARHFQPALRSAAATAVAQPVATTLSDAGRAEIEKALRKAAEAIAFDIGLILLPPFQCELSSASFDQQQREATQRRRIEEVAVGRLDHLRRATELLRQFESIRAASPGISAAQVLERIAPQDRGAVLQALLAGGSETRQRVLYAAAGGAVVRIDLVSMTPTLIELPPTLGPLRSVTPIDLEGQPRLLVGARSGVLLVDPQEPAAAIAYADPELNSPLGFNRAAFLPGSGAICATHGEAGLVRWNLGAATAPAERFPESPARAVVGLSSMSAAWARGNMLSVWDAGKVRVFEPQTDAAILSIIRTSQGVLVVHENSLVVTFDPDSRTFVRQNRFSGSLSAAAALPWMDGVRLLLACADGQVDCVGTEDSLMTRYCSAYRGVRGIAGCATHVAAISPDRQRLIIWQSWDGTAPAQDLHVLSLARHRIADLAFA
jgi:hypothetical protein